MSTGGASVFGGSEAGFGAWLDDAGGLSVPAVGVGLSLPPAGALLEAEAGAGEGAAAGAGAGVGSFGLLAGSFAPAPAPAPAVGDVGAGLWFAVTGSGVVGVVTLSDVGVDAVGPSESTSIASGSLLAMSPCPCPGSWAGSESGCEWEREWDEWWNSFFRGFRTVTVPVFLLRSGGAGDRGVGCLGLEATRKRSCLQWDYELSYAAVYVLHGQYVRPRDVGGL